MKYLFSFVLLAFTFNAKSQNIDAKPVNNRYVVLLDSVNYFIKRDTSNGIINVHFVPTSNMIKDMESELGSISTELAAIQSEIDLLQQRKKDLNRKQKEVVAILGKLRFKIRK